MFFDEDLFTPLILSATWVAALFLYLLLKDYENKQKEAEARSRHRAQQDLEWRRQLQMYPWLRQIIAQHERLEGQIALNMLKHNGRIVGVEVHGINGTRAVDPAPPKQERVNWKTEGF